jgi:hypothetical protein
MVKIETIKTNKVEYELEPPPPSFSCTNSITLKEWFFAIVIKEKPVEDSMAYNFVLFGSENCYAIALITSSDFNAITKEGLIDNNLAVKYYSLSKNGFNNFSFKQVLNEIRSQIKEFSKSKEFEESALAKAKSITIRFDDAEYISLK